MVNLQKHSRFSNFRLLFEIEHEFLLHLIGFLVDTAIGAR